MKVVKLKTRKRVRESAPAPADKLVNYKELPLALKDFLRQLSGLEWASLAALLNEGAPLPYAAQCIAPHLGLEEAGFNKAFITDLSSPYNLKIIQREFDLQAKGLFNPYNISLRKQDGRLQSFLVAPRPFGESSLASVAVCPESGPQKNRPQNAQTQPAEAQTQNAQADAALVCPTTSAPAQQAKNFADKSGLARILDFFPGYIVIIDSEHKIRFENHVFRQIFGSGANRKCYEILRGQDKPCRNCPPLTVLHSRSLCISEWASQRLGQAFRVYSYPFEDTEGSQLVLKVGVDISAALKARQALELSEQRYSSITDNLTLGIAVLDSNLRLSLSNPQIRAWFPGKDPDGQTICELLGRACSNEGDCSHCPIKATFEDASNYEFEITLTAPVTPEQPGSSGSSGSSGLPEPSGLPGAPAQTGGADKKAGARAVAGRERCYRVLSCPIKNKSGKVRSAVLLLEDITERRSLMRQVQRAQQVEAMATLAGGIAHEVNQPLSALHLYAGGLQMLLEKQGDSLPVATVQERLGLIMNQAGRIREIISHMRSLAMQEEAPKAAPTSVKEAVDGAMSLLGSQLTSHGISIQFQTEKDLKPVMAVKVQLEQVFINLLANAMHAIDSTGDNMGDNAASGARRRKFIRIVARNMPDKKAVQIEVADTGPGISGSSGSRIFDPFFTTNEGHKGMGLGLSIVQTFVLAWGGEVSALKNHNELGGAAFYLSLPAAGQPAT